MRQAAVFLFLVLFSLISQAADWNEIPWRSGQILGISSRAGLTPVVVQLGTLSQVDHVGIVSVEQDGAWIYEFTNASGIQKVKISEMWDRSADMQRDVHYVLGEFTTPLTSSEWRSVVQKLDRWTSRADPRPPGNCIETVLKAFQGIRKFSVRTTSGREFFDALGPLPIQKIIQFTYPDLSKVPVIGSLFEGLTRVRGNIKSSLQWDSEMELIKHWSNHGDPSKFVRTLSTDKSSTLTASERNAKFAELARVIYRNRMSTLQLTCPALF